MKNINISSLSELLNDLNESIPSVSNIIKKSGINVILFPSEIQNNVMSLITMDEEKDSYYIYIRNSLCYETQRFMAAYMYFYLGQYYKGDMMHKVHYDEEVYDKKAYKDALSLLMPEQMFKQDIENGMSNKEISKKYQVSLYLVNERINLIERDNEKRKLKVLKRR